MSEICPICHQDHHAVHQCQGRVFGKFPKNRQAQREAALKRWKAWRQRRKEEYLAGEETPVQIQPQAEIIAPAILDDPGKSESKPTWRW